ncbi:hypothetical protein PROFUN_14755 [Planoprotostelium fungivorum]|uniref:Uncharacterized protein n=1 Tax=Planoprotostelium fungivorum TaxID=1890364 RepID=A0A2P6MXY8_9EUKA|nr:hypothetical protein PROFUN_14755 [Planoprotostelium fungivorum]
MPKQTQMETQHSRPTHKPLLAMPLCGKDTIICVQCFPPSLYRACSEHTKAYKCFDGNQLIVQGDHSQLSIGDEAGGSNEEGVADRNAEIFEKDDSDREDEIKQSETRCQPEAQTDHRRQAFSVWPPLRGLEPERPVEPQGRDSPVGAVWAEGVCFFLLIRDWEIRDGSYQLSSRGHLQTSSEMQENMNNLEKSRPNKEESVVITYLWISKKRADGKRYRPWKERDRNKEVPTLLYTLRKQKYSRNSPPEGAPDALAETRDERYLALGSVIGDSIRGRIMWWQGRVQDEKVVHDEAFWESVVAECPHEDLMVEAEEEGFSDYRVVNRHFQLNTQASISPSPNMPPKAYETPADLAQAAKDYGGDTQREQMSYITQTGSDVYRFPPRLHKASTERANAYKCFAEDYQTEHRSCIPRPARKGQTTSHVFDLSSKLYNLEQNELLGLLVDRSQSATRHPNSTLSTVTALALRIPPLNLPWRKSLISSCSINTESSGYQLIEEMDGTKPIGFPEGLILADRGIFYANREDFMAMAKRSVLCITGNPDRLSTNTIHSIIESTIGNRCLTILFNKDNRGSITIVLFHHIEEDRFLDYQYHQWSIQREEVI